MPVFQKMLERFNRQFAAQAMDEKGAPPISEIDPALFEPGKSLAEAAVQLEVAATGTERAFIDSLPAAIKESIRAIIHEDLTQREPQIAITFAWAPGYDYELSVWDCPGTSVSPGGITLMLRTRYPDDPHPAGSTVGPTAS